MAAAGSLPCEDQFRCSICLDVFTDPVTTPCGHNFCRDCIFEDWDVNGRSRCPLCNEMFYLRPQLRVNTFINEMLSQFWEQKAKTKSLEKQFAKPEEVPCDICTGTKLKAVKSCLVCLVSFCKIHLEPHLTVAGLKRHQLTDPVENLEGRMCSKHSKPLELFCKTDQVCVCMFCFVVDHKVHEVVPLTEEYQDKRAELKSTEGEILLQIQEKQLKVEEINGLVELSQDSADREKAEALQIFTSLLGLVERGLNQLMDEIEKKQRQMAKQARELIRELEDDISELMDRSVEVKQLRHSKDYLHLLQSFPTVNTVPLTKKLAEVSFRAESHEGVVMRAVAELEERLGKELKELFEAELKRVQQYAVDITLDPDTANPSLEVSPDGKQVYHTDLKKTVPNNPERFFYSASVIGHQGFSSGRIYFEVEVKGKTSWKLGVVRETVNRKRLIIPRPQNGFWMISMKTGSDYKALASTSVTLALKCHPEKVGVFVDYENGMVSFYDATSAAVMYSFTDCAFSCSPFREKLYPYFCPGVNNCGKNSAPLVICPVSQKA